MLRYCFIGVMLLVIVFPVMSQDQELMSILQEFETAFNEVETGLNKLDRGLAQVETAQRIYATGLNEAEQRLNDLEDTLLQERVQTQAKIDLLNKRNDALVMYSLGSSAVIIIGLIISFLK